MRHTSHHSSAPGYQHESHLGGRFENRPTSPLGWLITLAIAALLVWLAL